MPVANNSVVAFHYDLFDQNKLLLESSRDAEPTVYLHGANNIIRGLEAAMAGRESGEHFEVELAPEQAYGPRQSQLQQRVPIKHLVFQGKLRPGMAVQLNTDQGRRSVTVIKAGRHAADIDGNHPLAGQQLRFVIDIVSLRDADADEIAHGHAHGPGGHAH
ncbi:MAG: peptidylprolyl isomerase [Halieaceae bacterium]